MGRPHLFVVACLAFAGSIAACGLDISGTANGLTDDGGGVGSGDGAIVGDALGGGDGAIGDGGTSTDVTSPPLDGAGPCTPNGTVSCFAPPSGWTVVAYAPGAPPACPAPFTTTQSDVEEGPTANNACRCDPCTVTSQPSCVTGAISSSYDNDNTHLCLLPGVSVTNGVGGACNMGMYNLAADVKLTPPGVSGGGCTSTLSKHKDAFTFAGKGRACAAADPTAAGCKNGICAPAKPPTPYAICIASSGVQTVCPTPFTVKHVVGTDVSFDCASTQCGCTVNAQCGGGSLSFYTDNACQDNVVAIAADDSCHAVVTGGGGPMFRSYKYTASPTNVTCAPVAPAPASNVQLVGATTICCAQ